MNKIINVLLNVILLTIGSQTSFAEEIVFAPDEHCLALLQTEQSTPGPNQRAQWPNERLKIRRQPMAAWRAEQ